MKKKVLLIDPTGSHISGLIKIKCDCEVEEAFDLFDASKKTAQANYDFLIVDPYRFGAEHLRDWLEKMRLGSEKRKIVLLSSYKEKEMFQHSPIKPNLHFDYFVFNDTGAWDDLRSIIKKN